ncbi:hypothetical protein PIB30_014153 [Stylosanthes scabra]|uniref:Trichome birefringence-like N-terminal domain-containing protein n=1 Tax=Stylosanthes scabra TaxID=79078 RepID=A0ABU6U6W2_9FABA|nr:hypothetical protein [Stylosanthes scabra]
MNNKHFKRVHICLALFVLIFTALLWTWQSIPIATTLRSVQEWYRMPSDSKVDIADSAAVEFIPSKSREIEYNQNVTSPSNEDYCDYAKGRWVADNRRPLYSWSSCKHFIAPQWSCRSTTRQDFSFEGYRWQPQNCDMPEFDPSAFLTK